MSKKGKPRGIRGSTWMSGKTDVVRIAKSLIPRILTIARALDGKKPEDVQVHITYKDEE